MPSRLPVVLVSLLLALPVVIFWLWLVIVPARVAVLCPEECLCETGGYIVKCEHTSLTAVPLIHLTDVRDLWFIRNKMTLLLARDNFVSLTELEDLIFWDSGLRKIDLGTFNGLTKLRRLFIVGTEISEILPDTFGNLISLEDLNLAGNRIEHVDRDMFSGLFKLKYINLSGNKLQYLHPDTFLRLPNLQKLHLSYNPGLQIPTDRNIIKSHSLSVLSIGSSNINSVSVEIFANVSSLEWLDLNNNSLRTVDINILRALPKLSKMHLYWNPLQCDCQLQEVWRWCEERNIWTEYGVFGPKCDTPRKVKGMGWGVLEKGWCLQGKIHYNGDYRNYTDTETWYSYGNSHNSEFLKHYDIPVYAVPFSIGITGNLILLFIIICNKDMRTLPNMYILNLAISDIIYLTVLFSEACVNRKSITWPNGDFPCTIIPFCRRLSVGLSAYSVAVLSIQRYRVTVNPFHVRVSSKPTWRGTVATIFGVWIVAALLAVPSTISNDLCVEWTYLESTTYYHRVVIFELLASCVLPLCVIAFTYIMTARHLVESSRSISEGTENPQLETRRNTAKIVVGLTVVFLISYVPYHVFWTYIIWTQHIETIFTGFNTQPEYAMQYLISTCFLLINSCLNPVALFCTSSPFRQHLVRYLTCCCKRNSPSTDLELTRRK
jgi:hypothetical protein